MTDNPKLTLRQAGQRLHELTLDYQRQHTGTGYAEAFRQVALQRENWPILEVYAQLHERKR